MGPKEACERFEMFLSAVLNSSKSLSDIRQSLEAGKTAQALKHLQDIQESIDDMLSSFDRLLELSGGIRRYEPAYLA